MSNNTKVTTRITHTFTHFCGYEELECIRVGEVGEDPKVNSSSFIIIKLGEATEWRFLFPENLKRGSIILIINDGQEGHFEITKCIKSGES